jgi:hypothetical protein
MPHVIVWDMETVPDLKGFAAANETRRRADISDRGGIYVRLQQMIAAAAR